MNDLDIDLKQIFLAFWKIKYYMLIFPCICVLLVVAYSLSGKILEKNKIVYYVQFNDINVGNEKFLQDSKTLIVYNELSKKWGLDANKLRNSINVEAISPKTTFIEKKFKNKLNKPGLKAAEIDQLANNMVKEINNANKTTARISFDYQSFGLSIAQASEILISFPSLWNKVSVNSNLENLFMFRNTNINNSQKRIMLNRKDEDIINLIAYENISNALKTLLKLEKLDPRSFMLLTSKNGDKGAQITSKMEFIKTIYLIPFLNSAVANKSTDIIAFLNDVKMDKFEIEEKLNGIERTIKYLKKDNLYKDTKIEKKNLEQNEDIFKVLSNSRNNMESKLFVELLSQKTILEQDLARAKREINQVERIKKIDRSTVSIQINKQIEDTLDAYNIFIDDYKENISIKDHRLFNPLIQPRLVQPSKLINKLNLLLALLFGLCIGTTYGLILLVFRPDLNLRKKLNNVIKT